MSEHSRIRDRTLVLRVLVPSLEVRLRDKMKDAEDLAASRISSGSKPPPVPPSPSAATASSSTAAADSVKEALMDLEGVTCDRATDGSTLWQFHCDGATYPARLVNLPCPVELHKTHDHAMYYKCTDIAQMLVVYEDEMAMEEAENAPGYKMDQFPSYYPSGLTPPMKRVVERRFARREHDGAAPPRAEVAHVEYELQDLLERITKDPGKKGRSRPPSLAVTTTKVLEEVAEDVVDYAPWMDDYGKQPFGVEFNDQDPRCTKHPELWLDPEEIAKINIAEADRAGEQKRKTKKDGMKKKSRKKAEKEAAEKGPSVKKGIPAKKSMEEVDEITKAAAQMSQDLDPEDILGAALDDFFSFGDDDDDPIAGLEF